MNQVALSFSAGTPSFSGHETFVFRYSWMKKAVAGVEETPLIFNDDAAMARLGVGKNMVRSIRHWGLATRVLEEVPRSRGNKLAVSPLGALIFAKNGADPYLEDLNTLWLLHWNLATNEQKAATWCWAFNLFPAIEFTRDSLLSFLLGEVSKRETKSPSIGSLKRDLDCFIRTYTASRGLKGITLEDSLDCPLVELGLISENRVAGIFRFNRGAQRSLSDEVFVHSLLQFWNTTAPDRETLAFADVAYAFGSPGRVFKFDENSLIDRLERLETITHGSLIYGDTAGLKQIYRRSQVTENLLQRHYERSAALREVV